MALVTQADFAKLHKVSPKQITIYKQKGYLICEGGKVDVEASDAILKDRRLGRFKNQEGNKRGNSKGRPKGNTVAAFSLDDAEATPERFVNEVLKGAFASVADADRIKQNALALMRVLESQEMAGKLIDIERAEQIIFGAFRSIRDSWMNWPARVGALVAADLGLEADRVTEVLTNHVQEHLGELGEPDADLRREG
tara:strand:+ start:634 stop:1221 length:588 start_codon:yes stop_codon:yes gene_type:complete